MCYGVTSIGIIRVYVDGVVTVHWDILVSIIIGVVDVYLRNRVSITPLKIAVPDSNFLQKNYPVLPLACSALGSLHIIVLWPQQAFSVPWKHTPHSQQVWHHPDLTSILTQNVWLTRQEMIMETIKFQSNFRAQKCRSSRPCFLHKAHSLSLAMVNKNLLYFFWPPSLSASMPCK